MKCKQRGRRDNYSSLFRGYDINIFIILISTELNEFDTCIELTNEALNAVFV